MGTFGLRSRWSVFRLQIQTQKQTTILCCRSACTPDPSCSPECIMLHVSQTASNWGDSYFHHEQTQGKWRKNTCACKRYARVFPPAHRKINEPACRAGSFTDLIQSQVSAFKSLSMQITCCFLSLWCESSSRINDNISYIFLFECCWDRFHLCIYLIFFMRTSVTLLGWLLLANWRSFQRCCIFTLCFSLR